MVLNIDREKSPVTYNLLLQPTVIYVKSLQYPKGYKCAAIFILEPNVKCTLEPKSLQTYIFCIF